MLSSCGMMSTTRKTNGKLEVPDADMDCFLSAGFYIVRALACMIPARLTSAKSATKRCRGGWNSDREARASACCECFSAVYPTWWSNNLSATGDQNRMRQEPYFEQIA